MKIFAMVLFLVFYIAGCEDGRDGKDGIAGETGIQGIVGPSGIEVASELTCDVKEELVSARSNNIAHDAGPVFWRCEEICLDGKVREVTYDTLGHPKFGCADASEE